MPAPNFAGASSIGAAGSTTTRVLAGFIFIVALSLADWTASGFWVVSEIEFVGSLSTSADATLLLSN